MKLEFVELTKKYGNHMALDSFCYEMNEGVYALLGKNGAGKSTLLNLLTDNVTRTSGKILCDGSDILSYGAAYRKRLGYMPQQQGFYEMFSARAFLLYMAELKGIPGKAAKKQADELLEVVNLSDVAHVKMGKFSGGMKQRALLAQALLGEPDLIILDEPTAGLDPMERIRFRNYIKDLARDKTIIYATHVVSDIETIADELLFLKQGRIVQSGTLYEIQEGVPEEYMDSGENMLEQAFLYYMNEVCNESCLKLSK